MATPSEDYDLVPHKEVLELKKKVENLENLFSEFDVSYLRELQQKTLILNLKKYAWSLQGLILEKYSDIKPDEGI